MRIARGELHDVYVDAGRSAVMVGEQVLVLSEVASAILEAVPEAGFANLEDVAAAVELELGAPPAPVTATEVVRDQVHELIAHNVLVLEDPLPPLSSTPRAVEALRDALRHILGDASTPWSPPDDVAAGELLAAAEQHHVVSFLHVHRARLALPPGAAASLHAIAAQRSAAVDVLVDDLHAALEALDRAGVRALAVKGIALAVQAHGDATARGAGDLDLLVPPEDVVRAHDALTREGWVHDDAYPAPGPSWAWRHYQRTGHELSLPGSRSTIDLHWHLAPAHGSFPEFDMLWLRRQTVTVGDGSVPTLSPYDALAHAAGHAARDEWRWLRNLVDVQLLARDPEVWTAASRPLRPDQLTTVVLSARMFGMPATAPSVLRRTPVDDSTWSAVLARQEGTAATHHFHQTPGASMITRFHVWGRTRSGPVDAARLLGYTLIPPWSLAGEQSPHAYIAAPRALWRRGADVVRRLRR